MRQITILQLCILIAFGSFTLMCSAKNEIKYYRHWPTELTGTVKNLTFPGPPNYEDINNGDMEERCPYLILDHPIDTRISPSISEYDTYSEPYQNVKVVQLAIMNNKLWKLMKDGTRVKVRGDLFGHLSGHHHTRALMGVKEANKLKKLKHTSHKKIVWDEDNAITGVEEMQTVPASSLPTINLMHLLIYGIIGH